MVSVPWRGSRIFVPAMWFRYFHLAHHRHTQDPARDPELALPPPKTKAQYLLRLTGWFYWSGSARTVVGLAFGAAPGAYVPPRAFVRVRREAQAHLALYAALVGAGIAFGWLGLLDFWLVPMLLAQPVLRAYLMAEHTACPMVPDMLANTRTTFCHRAIRWLAWEMPWHTAHHAAPTVPFHRLAELSGLLARRLKATADGYGDAHRQIRETLSDG